MISYKIELIVAEDSEKDFGSIMNDVYEKIGEVKGVEQIYAVPDSYEEGIEA